MRILKFNTTTFNICKSQGYDIHYPPVNKYSNEINMKKKK